MYVRARRRPGAYANITGFRCFRQLPRPPQKIFLELPLGANRNLLPKSPPPGRLVPWNVPQNLPLAALWGAKPTLIREFAEATTSTLFCQPLAPLKSCSHPHDDFLSTCPWPFTTVFVQHALSLALVLYFLCGLAFVPEGRLGQLLSATFYRVPRVGKLRPPLFGGPKGRRRGVFNLTWSKRRERVCGPPRSPWRNAWGGGNWPFPFPFPGLGVEPLHRPPLRKHPITLGGLSGCVVRPGALRVACGLHSGHLLRPSCTRRVAFVGRTTSSFLRFNRDLPLA